MAANGPAWASPRSLGSQFWVQAGCAKWGPPRYLRLVLGPTYPFLPVKLMPCWIATCSDVFGACSCRQVKLS